MIESKNLSQFSILEIGVFTGILSEAIFDAFGSKLTRYVGVDPYIGDETDPYFKGYWGGKKSKAEEAYSNSKLIYEKHGATLLREMSKDYFSASSECFDVVIIDGDHRFEPALADLRAGWARVSPGGILICDDFGNPDHPGVTLAANQFNKECKPVEYGVTYTFFQKPPGRLLPYPLGLCWWSREADGAVS
ncbi:class I SAM-dependent methyltransferase [Xanthobacter agilis]|uniref:SAM-dependent methyltransferase n=1 Tax=Xanthobacter agilis TaxID=47492 RepID=A0ABU0LK16_XANAG|nr:class I SAM-dependent methyltransferase [Xanthobacter agilis]MDQ0507491.1 SAM-dependent methyltransferase [Xanthobacter agilis]